MTLVFVILLAVALSAMVVTMRLKGIDDDASLAFIFAALALLSGVFLYRFFKSMDQRT